MIKGNRQKGEEIISKVPFAFAIDGAAPETTSIAELMRGNASASGFSVIKDGEIDCVGTVGNLHAEIAGTESPALTTESIFEVASLSKPVVAYGTIHLLAEYDIDLNETIDSYLPTAIIQDFNTECVIDKFDTGEFFNKFRGKNITFRQLLEHSSGIVDPNMKHGEQWTTLLQNVEQRPPGTWRYSNAGYALLECLLENIAHKSFPEIMNKYVLAPLGMKDSTFSQTDETFAELKKTHRLVIGQYMEGVFTEPFVNPRAAGGLRTTLEDYARFIQALIRAYNETSGNPVKQMFHKQDRSAENGQPCHYGLGINVDGTTDDPSFGHNGRNYGFTTRMNFFPKRGIGTVVFTNHNQCLGLDGAIVGSIDAAYGWNLPPFRPVSVSSISEGAFSQYLGKYSLTFPDGGDTILLDIVKENHMLFLQLPFPTPTSPSFQVPLYQSPDDNGLISILSPPCSSGPMITIKIDPNNEAKRTLEVTMGGGKPLKAELIPAHKKSVPAWQSPPFQQPPSAPTSPLRPADVDTPDETIAP